MRVLLDECVTRLLKRDFVGHDVYTVEEAGLKGLKNSPLLRSASGHYDVLVTWIKAWLTSRTLNCSALRS